MSVPREPAPVADTAADDLPLPRMHETTQGDDMTENEREQRYADAIASVLGPGLRPNVIRAVMAVADAEQAEMSHRAWSAEAEASILKGRLARVEALIDQWDGEVGAQEDYQVAAAVRAVEACMYDLRAALDGDS